MRQQTSSRKKFQVSITEKDCTWSDEGAPFASQTFSYPNLLWFPFLIAVAALSITALNEGNVTASIFWIIYECYIVFDHFPFLCTNSVYKSPRFNFTYLSTIFFWGLEAIACIVATQSRIEAPKILLYNAFPHCGFIVANNFNKAAASKAFVAEKKKSWWIYVQVVVDTVIHCICLWYHLRHVSSLLQTEHVFRLSPDLAFFGMITLMLMLTTYVHGEEMSLKYFFAQFIPE